MPKEMGVWGQRPHELPPASVRQTEAGVRGQRPRDGKVQTGEYFLFIDYTALMIPGCWGTRPLGGRAHGTWVQAGAPAALGGSSGFSRPPRAAGASDCAHFGWGRGGIAGR